MENVEWGVEDGDGWRLLCGGSNVGVGNEPSDGALGVVYGGVCSGGVDAGDGAICWGPCVCVCVCVFVCPCVCGVGGAVGCTWLVPFVSVFVMLPLHTCGRQCVDG